MQKLTLSYSRTNRYLETLTEQNLISYDPITHNFAITPKGIELSKLNQQLATYISPVNSMIRKYSRYIRDPYDNDDRRDNSLAKEVEFYHQINEVPEMLKAGSM